MMSHSTVAVMLFCFRHQLPSRADFAEHCIHHNRRMTRNGHGESVYGQTTQGIGDCSLTLAFDAILSMLDFSGIAWNKNIDIYNLHVVKSTVHTETAISQCGCIDECASITLIAHCLAQYMSTLNVEHQKHVQSVLQSDTVSWISKLFR